jgi:hypothetical protein
MSLFPPRLPLHTIVVRAATTSDGREAFVYASEGFKIPSDRWISVQISPHVIQALQNCDLEEHGTDDRPLSRQEVEQKYGVGPLQRRALRSGTKREQQTAEKPLPAPASTIQEDVASPAPARRRKGRPSKEAAERVQRRNELVGILIAKDVEPTRAYQEVAGKFDETPDAVRMSYKRSLKPAKRPKLPTPTK